MKLIWKVLLGFIALILGIFAVIGFKEKVGHPAWQSGEWFTDTETETNSVAEREVVSTEEDSEVEKAETPEDTDDPILPDVPSSDLHTSWVGDISFIGYKGQVSYPNDKYIQEMVESNHVFSFHQIDAYDDNMIFIVTWDKDLEDMEGSWYTNEYFVENFDWDQNSPEEFYDRFVEEIEDWTVPNSIKEDTTIVSGTTVHATIFFGTQAEDAYYEFDYTKP
jgi:hypothetical protein